MTRPNPPRLLVALLACLALGLPLACGSDEPQLKPVTVDPGDTGKATLQVAGRAVRVELARDDAERAQGLMHRPSLAPDAGMLFLFTDSAYRRFWMRNTLIPLDIIYLDERGCVINVHEAAAGVEQPGYTSLKPARFVLELNRGWCQQHGLVAGDCIEISDVLRALAQPAAGVGF